MNDESPGVLKERLRAQILAELRKLSPAQRLDECGIVCSRLKRQMIWLEARFILFYAPLRDEIDIWGLAQEAIDHGKVAALPQFDRERGVYRASQVLDLRRDVDVGRFGILEPKTGCPEIPVKRLDLILVPGVAFDLYGRRLGRGKGWYDRLLMDAVGAKCGLGFDCQLVTEIPAEPHDVTLDYVATPSRWLVVRQPTGG
jgi:5-formyltetrahydrofolate cyclo-ligase